MLSLLQRSLSRSASQVRPSNGPKRSIQSANRPWRASRLSLPNCGSKAALWRKSKVRTQFPTAVAIQHRRYSNVNWDSEEEDKEAVVEAEVHLLEDEEEVDWSANSAQKTNNWNAWSKDLHGWLEALHRPDMTLEIGKRVWTDYKKHVKTHPELAAFLPLLFQQVGPYLYFDHLESLYSDLVETEQLTPAIGRDMVRQYMKRRDVKNAEVVADDLRNAGIDISGSTVGSLIRLHGAAGNSNQVWKYFDEYVQTQNFQESQYPYLCGCLFVALGSLPGNQDERLLSIFHLMITGEEYFPNAPEYYDWLDNEFVDNPDAEMPDFPLQQPIILPNPDAFCFNAALQSVKSAEAATTIWELAIRLRRVSPFVYANYVISLASSDTKLAAKAFEQFSKSTYANKKWEVVHLVRRRLGAKAIEANDIDTLRVLLDEKFTTRHVSSEDVVSMLSLQMKRGFSVNEIWDSLHELCKKYEIPAFSSTYRGVILEYLHREEPENAEHILANLKAQNFALHFHHCTPIPLWYLNKWLASLEPSSGASDAEKKRLEEGFARTNEELITSSVGPSAFYIRVVASLHPSAEFSRKFLDRAVTDKHTSNKVVFNFTKHQAGKFQRGIAIVNQLHQRHGSLIGPVIARTLVEWALREGQYAECFNIARRLIKSTQQSSQKAQQQQQQQSQNQQSYHANNNQQAHFLLGGWVFNFTVTVLRPLGIRTPLHAFYSVRKYEPLTLEQLDSLLREVDYWERTARKNNFQPTSFASHSNASGTSQTTTNTGTANTSSNASNPAEATSSPAQQMKDKMDQAL